MNTTPLKDLRIAIDSKAIDELTSLGVTPEVIGEVLNVLKKYDTFVYTPTQEELED